MSVLVLVGGVVPHTVLSEIYAGLRELARGAFPRRCANCGRVYESSTQFLSETEALRGNSGLKAGYDDDDERIVELFRNCPCGSTLMELYEDRRDNSAEGQRRRERFAALLGTLQSRAGIDPALGRQEIRKALRGEHSEVLARIGYEPTQGR